MKDPVTRISYSSHPYILWNLKLLTAKWPSLITVIPAVDGFYIADVPRGFYRSKETRCVPIQILACEQAHIWEHARQRKARRSRGEESGEKAPIK